jgi:outer membrane protein assembly factor BamB
MGSDDDLTALEAVWGREASATAPPAPRPDIQAIVAPEAPAPPPRPRRRGPLVGGIVAAVLVVAGLVAVAVAVGDDDAGRASEEREGDGTTPATTTGPAPPGSLPEEPAWEATIGCEDVRTTGDPPRCPVAVDGERAYALVGRGGGAVAVEARALADGEVRWTIDLPAGASGLRRDETALLVTGVGPEWDTLSLDPVTGAERWRAPGVLLDPVGPEHVLLDGLVGAEVEERGTMAVLDADDGGQVVRREGTPASLYIHPCGEADLALVRQDLQLTAIRVPDGSERWSVPVRSLLDSFQQVHCDERTVAFVDGGTLVLLDAGTGEEVGATQVAPATTQEGVTVLGVAAGTVVVGSADGARGFRADAGLEQLWRLRCDSCGPRLPTGAAGEDVVVLIEDRAVVRSGADGSSGPTLDLDGFAERRLDGDRLLAWGADGVVVADPADLGRPRYLDRADVRVAAVGPTHLVVATPDRLAAYPLEG